MQSSIGEEEDTSDSSEIDQQRSEGETYGLNSGSMVVAASSEMGGGGGATSLGSSLG